MGVLPSQEYDEVCEALLEYLYDEYNIGFKSPQGRRMVVVEFLDKCDNREIDVR